MGAAAAARHAAAQPPPVAGPAARMAHLAYAPAHRALVRLLGRAGVHLDMHDQPGHSTAQRLALFHAAETNEWV